MLERGTGRIINVSSIIGEIGNVGQANYAASKSGLFGLTKTLAREVLFHLKKAQMAPGGHWAHRQCGHARVRRHRHAGQRTERVLDNIRSQIPVGRLGKPEEIARVVCFLASDDSSYITGQIWAVNGGLDM